MIEDLASSIAERRAVIGVIGLGYVGLPLALAATRAGFEVVGFDVNAERVEKINAGEPVISHLDTDGMRAAVATGRFRATSEMDELSVPDALLICVPTPLTQQREPDLSYIRSTARDIGRSLRRGQIVVLESTTWPGTTKEVLKPILEETGLRSGSDFLLAFSPEREDPGNQRHTIKDVPKITGADDPAARQIIAQLYSAMISTVVPVSSSSTAEAVKLTENIFRAVNIALVNELKVIYDAMGIDVWEVIEAAATKPFGFMPFQPGPGLGGHCIPIDPFYLTWKAREFDIATRFIELAGEINRRMPHYVIEKLVEALDCRLGLPLGGADILIVGIAYKRNVDDMRESPALKLIELLEERNAQIAYYDPYVVEIPQTREYPHLKGRRSISKNEFKTTKPTAALIVTDHDEVDYRSIVANARLIVDTRNVCAKNHLDMTKVVKS